MSTRLGKLLAPFCLSLGLAVALPFAGCSSSTTNPTDGGHDGAAGGDGGAGHDGAAGSDGGAAGSDGGAAGADGGGSDTATDSASAG